MSKNYIFFDLDNTLHSFSAAYKQATAEAFREINSKYPVLSRNAIASAYKKIQQAAETHAFVERKTSTQYRSERFSALLLHFGIRDPALVKHAVSVYGATIEKNMKPNRGVHEMLGRLGEKNVLCLVSEGPSDAQRKALKILGLEPFFSHVFISSEAGKAKQDGGLFRHALKQLGCLPTQVIHVGDSIRDILGASKAGIKVIWVNPKRARLQKNSPAPSAQVRTVQAIEKII